MPSPKSVGTRPDFSEVKVPEAFLVSAGRALFPDSGSDGTASISFAQGKLRSLCVPSEEGPAGVASHGPVVEVGGTGTIANAALGGQSSLQSRNYLPLIRWKKASLSA